MPQWIAWSRPCRFIREELKHQPLLFLPMFEEISLADQT
jgi:hypothetical protein